MNIYYYFDGNEFAYDTELTDFRKQLTTEDKLNYATYTYNVVDEKLKKAIEDVYGISSVDDIANNTEFIEDNVNDSDDYDLYEFFETEIKDYYEDSARTAYDNDSGSDTYGTYYDSRNYSI